MPFKQAKTKNGKSKLSTPEARREYQRRYYQLHKEKAKEYQRQYNLTHKRKARSRRKGDLMAREGVQDTFNPNDIMLAPPEKVEKILVRVFKHDRIFTIDSLPYNKNRSRSSAPCGVPSARIPGGSSKVLLQGVQPYRSYSPRCCAVPRRMLGIASYHQWRVQHIRENAR